MRLLLLIAATIVIYKTKFGLRLRSCGENPAAADSVGINVFKMRYIGVMISGAMAGMGEVALTFAAGSGFASTVAGYGFLALAVMIFGNWQPLKLASLPSYMPSLNPCQRCRVAFLSSPPLLMSKNPSIFTS